MGIWGRAVAISSGGLAGLGLGFYLKENYYLKRNKAKRDRLMAELDQLRAIRKRKTEKLQSLLSSSKAD